MVARHRVAAAAMPLLALGACEAEPARAPAVVAADGAYKARIDALAPGQRNAVFLRAVRDAGQDCQNVAGSAYGGEQYGMPSWVARCADGRDWLVMVDKGGTAHVSRREEKAGS